MEDHISLSQSLSQTYLLNTTNNEKIILNQPKFTIGRGLNNSHVVEHLQISRTHCIFEEINRVWCLTDQSSNGTFINQRRIPSKTPHMLATNDTIKLSDNHEYVFINKNADSLDNIDISDYVVEVTTSEMTDVDNLNGCEVQNVAELCNVTSTTTEPVTNIEQLHGSAIKTEYMDHTTNTTTVTSTFPVLSNITATACSSNTDMCEQPQTEKTAVNQKEQTSNNNDALEQVEDELQCVICTELFIKATTLNCSHSFCKYCIEEWRKKSKNCPICRANIITAIPTIVLDNCIAKVLESASDDVKKKYEEIAKSREKPETVPPIIIKAGKVLRTRNVDPIEISSEEDNSYDEDDDEFLDDDDENYNGVPGAYYGGYGHCFSCGDRGHWSNGCPYR